MARKTREEKAKAKIDEQREKIGLIDFYSEHGDMLNSLMTFPGTLSEYESLVGYKCEIIPHNKHNGEDSPLSTDQFLSWDDWQERENPLGKYRLWFQQRMVDQGIEAVIHYSTQRRILTHHQRGIPVRRVPEEQTAEPEE